MDPDSSDLAGDMKFNEPERSNNKRDESYRNRDAVHYMRKLSKTSRRCDHLEQIDSIFTEMESSGIQLTIRNFNCVAQGLSYRKLSTISDFEWLLSRMAQANIQPNVVTFNTLMAYHVRKGNPRGASEVFEDMANMTNLQPDTVSYNIYLRSLAKLMKGKKGASRMLKDFERVIDEMTSRGHDPDVITYNTIIDSFAAFGDVSRVEHWVSNMRSQGYIPDDYTNTSIIKAYARRGKIEDMFRIFSSSRWVSPQAKLVGYNTIIDTLAFKRDLNGCLLWLSKMEDDMIRPNNHTYSILMKAFSRADNTEGLLSVFDTIERNGITPSIVLYSIMINHFAMKGDMNAAEQWLTRMSDDGLIPNVTCITTMMKGYSLSGDEEKMLEVYSLSDSADESQSTVDSDKGRLISLNIIVHHYAKQGNIAAMNEWLNVFQEKGFNPDLHTFGSVMYGYTMAPEVTDEDISAIFDRFLSLGVMATHKTFSIILNHYVRKGDRKGTQRWLRTMKQLYGSNESYRTLASTVESKLKRMEGEEEE